MLAAGPLPAPGDRPAWRQLLHWPDSCEQGFQYPDPAFAGIEIHALNKKRSLVQVTCTLGAYQGYQIYYLVETAGAKPASRLMQFPVLESPDSGKVESRQTEEVLGTAEFDARTHQLKVLNRFRGPGDCGTLAEYGFAAGTVRVVSMRYKSECDGQGAEHPELWPKRVNASR